VARPFATIRSVAEARLRATGQRLGQRAALIGGCGLAALIFLVFALAAATVALSEWLGLLAALVIMAFLALAVLLVLVAMMAAENRRARRVAARRAALDRQFLQAAAISAAPRLVRLPGRTGLGLALVGLGAALVLIRRRGAGDED
jgi:hypothetical protein